MGQDEGQGRSGDQRLRGPAQEARRVGATAVGRTVFECLHGDTLSLEDISDALGIVAKQIDALSDEGAKASVAQQRDGGVCQSPRAYVIVAVAADQGNIRGEALACELGETRGAEASPLCVWGGKMPKCGMCGQSSTEVPMLEMSSGGSWACQDCANQFSKLAFEGAILHKDEEGMIEMVLEKLWENVPLMAECAEPRLKSCLQSTSN